MPTSFMKSNAKITLETIRDLSQQLRTVKKIRGDVALEHLLWKILSAVVADDCLKFRRAILFLEDKGEFIFKMALGPLNRKDFIEQNEKWTPYEKKWEFAEISNMFTGPLLKSKKLNSCLNKLKLSEECIQKLHSQLIQNNQAYPKLLSSSEEESSELFYDFISHLPSEIKFESIFISPLISKSNIIGLLIADDLCPSNRNKEDFPELLSWLQYLADQLAVAFEFHQQLKSQDDFIRRLTDIDNSTIPSFLNTGDMKELLSEILRNAVELIEGTGGLFFLIEEKSGERYIRCHVNHMMDKFDSLLMRLGEGVAGKVAQTGNSMIENNFQTSNAILTIKNPIPGKNDIAAIMSSPLKKDNKVIGVIDIITKHEHKKFKPQQQDMLDMFAALASNTIVKAEEKIRLKKQLSLSPFARISVDANGEIIEFNQAAALITGHDRDAIIKTHVKELYWEGLEQAKRIQNMLVKSSDGNIVIYTDIKHINGNRVPIRLTATLIKDDLNRILGSTGVMKSLLEIRDKEQNYKNQQLLLYRLRSYQLDKPIHDIEELRKQLIYMLSIARQALECEWLVLFANTEENGTVLPHIVKDGNLNIKRFPHFNWKKAGIKADASMSEESLENESKLISDWNISEEWQQIINNGIRGENDTILKKAIGGVPIRLADNYRALLLIGPEEKLNTEPTESLLYMKDFILGISDAIGTHALTWLQNFDLIAKHEWAENKAALIHHRAKTSLTPIMGTFYEISKHCNNPKKVKELSTLGENQTGNISDMIKNVLKTGMYEMEPDDLKLELIELAPLVHNIAISFSQSAEKRNIELRLDESLEFLPRANIDRILFSVALGNLIDNNIKYAAENSYIFIFSEKSIESNTCTIKFTDIGEDMPTSVKENFSEPGKRHLNPRKLNKIPGSGYGLWEAYKISTLHNGKINFTSEPYYFIKENKYLNKVTISLTIPCKI